MMCYCSLSVIVIVFLNLILVFNGFSFTRKHLNLLFLALKCPFGVTLTYFNKNEVM